MEAFLPSPDSVRYFIREIAAALPRPIPATEANFQQRNRYAAESIAALMPASWSEVLLASHYVLQRSEAVDCHRFANDPRTSNVESLRALTLAQRFSRTSQATFNQLLRTQSFRQKRETEGQSDAAILTLRALILEALEVESIPSPPEPEPEPGPITDEMIDAANKYAELYPHRIPFIRKHGCVPDFAAFKLDDKELIRAIVHADTPQLNALSPKPKEYPPGDPRSRHNYV